MQTHHFCLLSFLVKWCPSYLVTQAASLSLDFFPDPSCSPTPSTNPTDHECCRLTSIYYFHECFCLPVLNASTVFRPLLLHLNVHNSASQFFCPSSPFHRDDSKARTGPFLAEDAQELPYSFREKAWFVFYCLPISLVFSLFSIFSRYSQPSPPGSFPLSQGSFNGHSSMRLSLVFLS